MQFTKSENYEMESETFNAYTNVGAENHWLGLNAIDNYNISTHFLVHKMQSTLAGKTGIQPE